MEWARAPLEKTGAGATCRPLKADPSRAQVQGPEALEEPVAQGVAHLLHVNGRLGRAQQAGHQEAEMG